MKASRWMFIAGGALVLIALCFVPGSFSPQLDETILSLAATLFIVGTLLAAAGFFFRAVAVRNSLTEEIQKTIVAPPRVGCKFCGAQPRFRCAVHEMNLCQKCILRHDSTLCLYGIFKQAPAAAGASSTSAS